MKTKVDTVSKLQRKIHVELPIEVVNQAFNEVFADIQKEVSIKGFRKGKAPLATVKSMYKDRVQVDVSQQLIQRNYPKALEDAKAEPITYPEFEFEDAEENKPFNFTADFDVRPEVELKKYEGLVVEREKLLPPTERFEKVIENIRNSHAKIEALLEDRPAQNGDVAVVDFEGFVNGAPLERGQGTDHQLELGSNSFIVGFEEGIVGMKIGQERTLDLKFPTPYHAEELAGQAVQFKVKLKELKKRVLPELTDDFVKETLKMETFESLKTAVIDDLQKEEQKRIEDKYKNNLLKALVKANVLEVPPKLVEEQKKNLEEDFRKRFTENQVAPDEIESYVAKWDQDFRATATEMVQVSFLIDAVARKHDLVCKREDVDAKFSEYAAQTGIEIDKIRDFYSKPESLSRLTYTITEEKVVKYLTDKAQIKEVEPKRDEPEGPGI